MHSKIPSTRPLSFLSSGIFLVATLSLLISSYFLFGEIVVLGIVGGILAVSLCFLRPEWWIYGVMLSSYFFYAKSPKEESSQPILFAMAYHLSLLVWMCGHIWLKKQKIIRHWIDLMFVLFIVFLALNGILALVNEVSFVTWIKGWQLYLIVLYYFPIREIFKTPQQQTNLLVVCAIVLLIQGTSNIYQYKIALTNFKFASQLLYVGIRQGASIFTVASLVTLVGVVYSKKPIVRSMLLVFHIFCFGVLLVSLARTAWVGYVIGFIMIGIVSRGAYSKKFIIGSLWLGGSMLVVSTLFFGRYTNVAFNVVNQRFSSSAGFATDPSYLSRILENEVLLNGITEYPLGGEGLQKSHQRYDAISRYTVVNTYAHNNYLGSAQKMGLPLALLFFGIFISLAVRNWRITRRSLSSRELFFSISSLASLTGLFVINFVGSVFDQREGMFLLAVIFAFSAFAYHQDENSTPMLRENNQQ